MEIRDLSVVYRTPTGTQCALANVNLKVLHGEVLGLVGESGSGKSTLAFQMLGYLQPNATRVGGSVFFNGTNVATLPAKQLQRLRGNRIGFVPQNPTTALNPAMTVGDQIAEVLRVHKGLDRTSARKRIAGLMQQVGLNAVSGIAERYPHRLSGGQQQRIAIAMALACEPKLIVLDEPTTGLDVTVQRQIIELLKDLRDSHGVSMVYVTHDLALLRQIADRLGVMFRGELVEIGDAEEIFTQPRHQYTRELLAAVPSFQSAPHLSPAKQVGEVSVLSARELRITYGARRGLLGIGGGAGTEVVRGVELTIDKDETLALIGESGSGKSTIARALCGLVEPRNGTIRYQGRILAPTVERRQSQARREIQYIFQNPDASLNPRMRIREILARPLDIFFGERGRRIIPKLEKAITDVRLPSAYLERFPRELSGGERQRVAIARALIARPSVLLCDEVLSALDVSVQASVLELLRELRKRTGISMLFISHDLGTVKALADRVAVLYRGEIVETGPTEQIFARPQHPYTRLLLSAAPMQMALRVN
jgi:peptide/nickel transport system ATP-binding protein